MNQDQELLGMMAFRADGPLTEGQTYAVQMLLASLLGTDPKAELTIQHARVAGAEAVVLVVMRHDLSSEGDHVGLPVAVLLDAEVIEALGDLLQPPEGVRVDELDEQQATPPDGVEVYGIPMD